YEPDTGVVSSADQGHTWSPDPVAPAQETRPPDRIAAILASGVDPRIILAGGDQGIWRSEDGGASWTASNLGLLASAPNSVSVGPPRAVYCSAAGYIFRSRDHAAHWRKMHTGGSVVADPVRP